MAAIIAQPAAAVDIHLNQRSRLSFSITWTVGGVAQSLAGMTVRSSFAVKAGATPWFTLAPGDGITIEPGGVTGEIDVVITAARSALVTRDGVWDLIVYDVATDTEVRRLAEGLVVIDKAVTVVTP